MRSVGVFCGASENLRQEFYDLAFELGSFLAKNGRIAVHGGIDLGMMRSLNEGCKKNGGKTIGIIPDIFTEERIDDYRLSESVLVKDVHHRKIEFVRICDCFILLPGGFGSLDEFFFLLTQFQTQKSWKRIIIMDYKNYYFSLHELINVMVMEKFCTKEEIKNIIFLKNITSLKDYINI